MGSPRVLKFSMGFKLTKIIRIALREQIDGDFFVFVEKWAPHQCSGIDGGLSGGSSVCTTGSQDPNRRQR